MRVFVAGATGAIGRFLVPRLLEAGHEVSGMTRSEERAAALRSAGATPVVCDALDAAGVEAAVRNAAPEAVVNQLTDLPASYDPRRKDLYASTDRLRREGTRTLVEAAKKAGARRIVSQSIAFLYAPEGAAVKLEDARAFTDAPAPFGPAVAAALEAEERVLTAADLHGIVLRYGFFYGPGTYYARGGSIAEQVRRRRFPVVGRGQGLFSHVHVADAAEATVLALDRGEPGAYNVVDDDPAPMREWLPAYAGALEAKPPLRVPAPLVRLLAGRFVASMGTELRGASNAKAREELGWVPAHPSWRSGFAAALESEEEAR